VPGARRRRRRAPRPRAGRAPGATAAGAGARGRRRRRRAADPRRLEAEQRADAAGVRELAGGQADDRAAVGERVVDGEVGALGRLDLVPVDGAAPRRGRRPPAARALEGAPRRPGLEEEEVDAPVGRRRERLLPAGARTAAAAPLLAPALERLAL